jgi:hypothetical protein
MSTDRELLELAAKAAGWYCPAPDALAIPEDVPVNFTLFGKNWNPLTDDGDALRLFTRMPFCKLYVSEIGCTVLLPPSPPGAGPDLRCDEYADEHGGDLQSATRRAIVRAAAELGRSMP